MKTIILVLALLLPITAAAQTTCSFWGGKQVCTRDSAGKLICICIK